MNTQQLKNIPIMDISDRLGLDLKPNRNSPCVRGHGYNTPCFHTYTETNTFKCFSCGIQGSNIDLVMEVKFINFKQAVNWIKSQYSAQDAHRGRLWPQNIKRHKSTRQTEIEDGRRYSDVYQYFINSLENQDAVDYLMTRGIESDITIRHNIKSIPKNQNILHTLENKFPINTLINSGLYSISKKTNNPYFVFFNNRLVTPYFDTDNKTILGLEGRHIDNKENAIKTLWLNNIEKVFYNSMSIQDAGRNGKKICICEGMPNVLSIYQSGKWADWGHPLGIAGTAQNKKIIDNLLDKLEGYKIFIATDGDKAGNNFYDDFQTAHINRYFKPCERVLIPSEKDLNDLLKAGELND